MLASKFLRLALASTALASVFAASPVTAQVAPPPVRNSIDSNGVDLFLGTMNVNGPKMSAGDASHGIIYYRLARGTSWLDNVVAGTSSGSGSTLIVTFNGYSDSFTYSGSAYTSTEGNGATLVLSGHIYTYAARDGTVVTFDTNLQGSALGASQLGAATSITRPNGETLTLNNVQKPVCYYWVQSTNSCASSGYLYRLSDATSSDGYKLSFTYALDYPHSYTDVPTFYTLAKTVLSNTKTSSNLYTQNYTNYSGALTISSATRSANYTSGANGVTGITIGGGGSPDISVVYSGGKVYTVTNPVGTWTYTYSDSGGVRTVTVTNPASKATTYTFDIASSRMTSMTDATSRGTTWTYDSSGRPTKVTSQEGNYTQYTYDGRGNVTQTDMVNKAGTSTLLDHRQL